MLTLSGSFSPDLCGAIFWHKDPTQTREMELLQRTLLPSLCWVVLSKTILAVLLEEYLSNLVMIGRNWIII